jgi:hypothetical protein
MSDHPRTCILTGDEGENADDCTTHAHEGDLICPRCDGKWGEDTTCENCTDEAGNPRDPAITATSGLVGKTIARVEFGTVQSNYGDEPCTTLHFTDGTSHGFVHPRDED